MDALARYRPVVPHWDRFVEAVRRPEPTTVRVRTALAGLHEVEEELRREGFGVHRVAEVPGFLRLDAEPRSVSWTPAHWTGRLHVQQCVMGLPSLALGARPGERVLDLCAAPGGKTSHLAELMDDRGPLVAADASEKRIRGLLGNLYRLLHPNVLVVAADARELPGQALFDRVLVDAPCSAEGNVRRKRGDVPHRSRDFERYVTGVQERLLRRAVDLVRPGGTVVYATCTFAPEENEAVVERVLEDRPVEVEEIPLEAPHAPGLTRFGDRRFDPRLAGAWRVYPHHLDSGGLFMARLRRTDAGGEGGGADHAGWEALPRAFPGESLEGSEERIAAGRALLADRFDLADDALERLGWTVRGNSLWVHRAEGWPFPAWEGSGAWRLVSAGLRAFKEDGRGGERPTNELLRYLDGEVRARRVALSPPELLALLRGETLSPPPEVATRGPVALVLEGRVVGRGVVDRRGLVSQIPKNRSRPLRRVLEEARVDAGGSPEGGGSPEERGSSQEEAPPEAGSRS